MNDSEAARNSFLLNWPYNSVVVPIRKCFGKIKEYRNISTIAKCSHGSVHAEVLAVRKEELARKNAEAIALQLAKDQAEAAAKLSDVNEKLETSFPDTKAVPAAA